MNLAFKTNLYAVEGGRKGGREGDGMVLSDEEEVSRHHPALPVLLRSIDARAC